MGTSCWLGILIFDPSLCFHYIRTDLWHFCRHDGRCLDRSVKCLADISEADRSGWENNVILMMALVIGKIIGSLFHWIYFVDISK